MTVYGFKSKQTAERLTRFSPGVKSSPPFIEGAVFYTPSTGIPARSGTVAGGPAIPGIAECQVYAVETENGHLVTVDRTDNTGMKANVYNIFAVDIAGDTLITAKRVGDKWVADAEDCPGDPSGPVNP